MKDRHISKFIIVFSCIFIQHSLSAKDNLFNVIPVVAITDLYHPANDPGDNLDLISGFALTEIDLKAIVLDITDAFRKPLADHPTLWKNPRGPREAGIIPVIQLNYIFDRNVPCAGIDGAMIKDQNNSYWQLPDMNFVSGMDIKLQRYLNFAFTYSIKHDFLRSMDYGAPEKEELLKYPSPFHVWETPVWIMVSSKVLICREDGTYKILPRKELKSTDRIIENTTRPCKLIIRDDGRFLFEYTDEPTNISIFFRDNIVEHELALQQAFPKLVQSYVTPEK